MDKPIIFVHLDKPLNYNPFSVKWIPKSAKIVTGGSCFDGTGSLQVYEMNPSGLDLILDIKHSKALKCGTFGASQLEQRHFAVGDFSGELNVYDLLHSKASIYSTKAHSSVINTIDGVGGLNIGKGAPELVTGGRDGFVKIWDTRQKDKPVVSIEPETAAEGRDCWAVCFGNSFSTDERTVCAGFDNGDIKMFDLKTMKIKWETNIINGVCGLQFDRKDIPMNKLVATTLESKFYVYDTRTFHEEKGFSKVTGKGHNSTVWSACHLPQNRDVFLTTGGNGSLYLWKYSYPSKRTKVLDDGTEEGVPGEVVLLQNAVVSAQPVISFDWSSDKQGLGACVSIDQTLKIIITTKLNTL